MTATEQRSAALTAEVLALAQALIKRPSVSPDDCGCQELLIAV